MMPLFLFMLILAVGTKLMFNNPMTLQFHATRSSSKGRHFWRVIFKGDFKDANHDARFASKINLCTVAVIYLIRLIDL